MMIEKHKSIMKIHIYLCERGGASEFLGIYSSKVVNSVLTSVEVG
jgi:hypothetical protein